MNSDSETECWTCLSNEGVRRISPGVTIFAGRYWLVEHAYPCALKGWLVIVLKRHVEALHLLTADECAELSVIQARACQLLHDVLGCEKEYILCLAESEHFHHIHFHVIPIAPHLPDALRGTHIFALLKVPDDQVLSPDEVRSFCQMLHLCWLQ